MLSGAKRGVAKMQRVCNCDIYHRRLTIEIPEVVSLFLSFFSSFGWYVGVCLSIYCVIIHMNGKLKFW